MGWVYTTKRRGETVREFFEREFAGTIVDCAVVNMRTAYIAYTPRGMDAVVGIICLLDYRPNEALNFGYKDMDEDMGPYEAECPERILKLLTPTSHPAALRWRERCRANLKARAAKPKLVDGCTVKFARPIEFADGVWRDTFRVEKQGRRVRFWSGYLLCRISGWGELDYEVVSGS